MNKGWAAIICTFLICSTILSSVYYVMDRDKYEFINRGDNNSALKVNKQTNETWAYSTLHGWIKIEQSK